MVFHFEEQVADNTGKDAYEYDQKLWTFGTSLMTGKESVLKLQTLKDYNDNLIG